MNEKQIEARLEESRSYFQTQHCPATLNVRTDAVDRSHLTYRLLFGLGTAAAVALAVFFLSGEVAETPAQLEDPLISPALLALDDEALIEIIPAEALIYQELENSLSDGYGFLVSCIDVPGTMQPMQP